MTEAKTGAAIVLNELAEVKKASAVLLNGSELPVMEKLIKLAESRVENVRPYLDKLAVAGTDPWASFWIERPTLGRFSRNVSTVETPREVFDRLVAAGWLLTRHFGRKDFITFRIGAPIDHEETSR